MIAFCHSCKRASQVPKVKGIKCPLCDERNSLERITKQEADALPAKARMKEAA